MRRADRDRLIRAIVEVQRLRRCLADITLRSRGKAVGLAMQALYSDRWPSASKEPTTMTSNEGVTAIAPNAEAFPDAEERFLVAFIESMHAAQHYMREIYNARKARGVDTDALETDGSTLLDLQHGYGRALDRRRRDLGTLLRNKRVTGGRR